MLAKSEKEIEILTDVESEAHLPFYATEGAAGADVAAFLKESLTIAPGSSALIPTGLRFSIPAGYELQVRPRSGLALKHQVSVLNTPGTIDSDYRGSIGIILINHGKNPFVVTSGMRIAQLVVASVSRAQFIVSQNLAETVRGEGGFGHTGF